MLLEGADIEQLLARVRAEHGPDARIVHADRVRVGGVGGFFAKERFEVAVELDDMTTTPEETELSTPAAPRAIRPFVPPQVTTAGALADADPLLALIGAAERDERNAVEVSTPAPRPAPAATPAATVAAPGAPATVVSTESPIFADVLARLARETARAAEPFRPAVDAGRRRDSAVGRPAAGGRRPPRP